MNNNSTNEGMLTSLEQTFMATCFHNDSCKTCPYKRDFENEYRRTGDEKFKKCPLEHLKKDIEKMKQEKREASER